MSEPKADFKLEVSTPNDPRLHILRETAPAPLTLGHPCVPYLTTIGGRNFGTKGVVARSLYEAMVVEHSNK